MAQGGSTLTGMRGEMYGKWARECVCVGGGEHNTDRCHRAVVMPKLIHSASRCFHTEKERVGSDVQEMDPLGNGPCPACCTLRLTLGGSRGWRGTWESGGGSESRSTGHRALWSFLSSLFGQNAVLFMDLGAPAHHSAGSPGRRQRCRTIDE